MDQCLPRCPASPTSQCSQCSLLPPQGPLQPPRPLPGTGPAQSCTRLPHSHPQAWPNIPSSGKPSVPTQLNGHHHTPPGGSLTDPVALSNEWLPCRPHIYGAIVPPHQAEWGPACPWPTVTPGLVTHLAPRGLSVRLSNRMTECFLPVSFSLCLLLGGLLLAETTRAYLSGTPHAVTHVLFHHLPCQLHLKVQVQCLPPNTPPLPRGAQIWRRQFMGAIITGTQHFTVYKVILSSIPTQPQNNLWRDARQESLTAPIQNQAQRGHVAAAVTQAESRSRLQTASSIPLLPLGRLHLKKERQHRAIPRVQHWGPTAQFCHLQAV